MRFRPKGMTFKSYKTMCKAMGQEPVSEDAFKAFPEQGDGDGDEGGGQGDDDGDEAEKGGAVDAADLFKSIAAFDATANALGTSGTSRETYLQARLDAGTITKSERTELGQLWIDGTDGGDNRTELVRKSIIDEGTPEGELVDASAFLKSMVDGINDRLHDVTTEVTRESMASRELIKGLGGLMRDMASVIATQNVVVKALGARMGVLERTPAPRRSVGADPRDIRARRITADTTGGGAAGDETPLTKAQIGRGFENLIKAASDASDDVALDRLVSATSRWEADGKLAPNMAEAIRKAL